MRNLGTALHAEFTHMDEQNLRRHRCSVSRDTCRCIWCWCTICELAAVLNCDRHPGLALRAARLRLDHVQRFMAIQELAEDHVLQNVHTFSCLPAWVLQQLRACLRSETSFVCSSTNYACTHPPIETSMLGRTVPSKCGQGTKVKKNCEPFVSGPAFAMDNIPGSSCFNRNLSSCTYRC